MCVLLGGKSNKATAVFAVLLKFYEHTYLIKCPSPPWEGNYSNIVVFVRKMVLHQNNFWNANVGNSINLCYWEVKAIKQLQCFLSSTNFISTHIRLSALPPPLGGHLFEYCSIC